ncbi:DELLA protein GAI1-like [Abrus precatorius]|uniref:DELLA protein GAI1-like n=1 Tax=Abrus precatorius TaxID=3816 RepID=A0A8B8MMG2_ABRPR|nr:DELLA protein GAI1-like [Abrus precatorius]
MASGEDSNITASASLRNGVGASSSSSSSASELNLTEEEESGIRLVHMLISCAHSLQRGNLSLAASLLHTMQSIFQHLTTASGIGKVASHFIHSLTLRIYAPPHSQIHYHQNDAVLYHHFYEASPYLKFAHFTANQAILQAFTDHNCLHVIDFHLMHGLQWPPLIHALAIRPGAPPSLRLTAVAPPSSDHREIGFRLADVARSVNLRFSFRVVAASRLEDVNTSMLQVNPKEAVAVNSVMQLHRVLGSEHSIDAVLDWIRKMNPRVMTVVEQEANHNQNGFLERFTEALCYYSAVFDSLQACPVEPDKSLGEMYVQREICNVLCCEGPARLERHEPLAKWKARLGKAGFEGVHLASNALKQASMLLSLFSAEGYSVEENEGCLTLCWHNRPLIAASAWRAVQLAHSDCD